MAQFPHRWTERDLDFAVSSLREIYTASSIPLLRVLVRCAMEEVKEWYGMDRLVEVAKVEARRLSRVYRLRLSQPATA